MKNIKYLLVLLLFTFFIPFKVFALSESEARKLISDYAYFVYNNKSSEISYAYPTDVKFNKITSGYYTENNKFGLDCNGFVSFVVYNALQANNVSEVFDTRRIALNGPNGWSSHSKYYSSTSYNLKAGETIQSASNRYDIVSKLKPGDLIGVVGYANSSYPSEDAAKSYTHIMLYVGNGKYIHNGSSGIKITSFPTISHGDKVGSSFGGSTHGSITILKLKNYESLSSSLLNSFRFPNGKGGYDYYNLDGSVNNNSNSNDSSNTVIYNGEEITHQYREEVKKIIYIIGIILMIIRIVVPILLIVFAMINLIKALSENDTGIKTVINSTILKVISAIIIFFILPVTNLVLKLVSQDALFKDYMNCLAKPSSCNVNIWSGNSNSGSTNSNNGTDNPSSISETGEVKISKTGIYISLTSNSDVSGYYFTKAKEELTGSESNWINSNKKNIDFVLLPGTYYIYTKLTNGKIIENTISVSASDIVDTKRAGDIKDLTTPFDTFLKSKNTSVDEFNDMISRSVSIAGYNTREGVAVAALALSQTLYNRWKIKIPWGCYSWSKPGVNPQWGGKAVQACADKGYPYVGIHCGGLVSWSFSNANFTMNSGIGSSMQIYCWGYGTPQKESGSYYGSVGDVVTLLDTSVVSVSCGANGKGGHVGVIVHKTSNGFWVTESDIVGIVTTFENANSTRWRTILDMSKTYAKKSKSNIIKGF